MRVQQWKGIFGGAAIALAALAAAACGDTARTGRSPAYVVIERLEGANGAKPDQFSTFVASDVLTLVKKQVNGQDTRVATLFVDPGKVTMHLELKNPGPTASPTAPSALNQVTFDRYRVVYVRTDGRSTQGVDVPYSFDGGMTVTVPASGNTSGFFELVRIIAKDESPLKRLAYNGGVEHIEVIAQVSFYGRDQAGNEVTATGNITVSFSDWGDPD